MKHLKLFLLISLLFFSNCKKMKVINEVKETVRGVLHSLIYDQIKLLGDCFDMKFHKKIWTEIVTLILKLKYDNSKDNLTKLLNMLKNDLHILYLENTVCTYKLMNERKLTAQEVGLHDLGYYLNYLDSNIFTIYNIIAHRNYLLERITEATNHLKKGCYFSAGKRLGELIRKVIFSAYVPS